ncbi:MAG: hypothetical protein ACTSWY_13825 [Promethearchaeota archaeon]
MSKKLLIFGIIFSSFLIPNVSGQEEIWITGDNHGHYYIGKSFSRSGNGTELNPHIVSDWFFSGYKEHYSSLSDMGAQGIDFYHVEYILFTDNLVFPLYEYNGEPIPSGNKGEYVEHCYGSFEINIEGSHHISITNNNIRLVASGYGKSELYMKDCNFINISDNSFSGIDSILFWGSSNIIISNNYFTEMGENKCKEDNHPNCGEYTKNIYFYNCHNVTFINNIFVQDESFREINFFTAIGGLRIIEERFNEFGITSSNNTFLSPPEPDPTTNPELETNLFTGIGWTIIGVIIVVMFLGFIRLMYRIYNAGEPVHQPTVKEGLSKEEFNEEKINYSEIYNEEIINTKIRKILKVSTRIKLDVMREALEMDYSDFIANLFDWANKFGFKIDGDYIIIENADIDGYIAHLDQQFKNWAKRDGKR